MRLIFGGVYQGKLAYAMERFKLTEDDVYRCSDDNTALPENKKIIYEADKWILALVKNNIDTEQSAKQFVDANKEAIVICNDISCGVVPVDPALRKWREAAGRFTAELSRISGEVIRLFCGIPSEIK